MNTFIGTKIIKAESMSEHTFRSKVKNMDTAKGAEDREGYKVVYGDGYTSWSPKDAFEAAYRQADGMNFGLATEAMLKGLKVTRPGWNGDSMYLAIQEGTTISAENCRGGVAKKMAGEGFESVTICPHIDMRSADGKCVVGWAPSQIDIFADDWQIVE